MEHKDFHNMTDQELLTEKEKLKKSKLYHAIALGFLAGILIFGMVSWSLAPEKNWGLLLPLLISAAFIYKQIKSPNPHKELEKVLKERNLD